MPGELESKYMLFGSNHLCEIATNRLTSRAMKTNYAYIPELASPTGRETE